MLKRLHAFVPYRRLIVLILLLLLSFSFTALPVLADPAGGGGVCVGC
jgi:hypothetical protein